MDASSSHSRLSAGPTGEPGSPSKKATSLRKMVRGARKAMERKPDKKSELGTASCHGGGHDAAAATSAAGPSSPVKRALLGRTKSADGILFGAVRRARRRNSNNGTTPLEQEQQQQGLQQELHQDDNQDENQILNSPTKKKLPTREANTTLSGCSSPTKKTDKGYKIHDTPQHGSPTKLQYTSPKKATQQSQQNQQPYGSHMKFRRNLPYGLQSCAPPYAADDNDDYDELDDDSDGDDERAENRSIGSTGFRDLLIRQDSGNTSQQDSSWGTLDPSTTDQSESSSATTSLSLSGHGVGLRHASGHALSRQKSDSSLVSWGDLSIGADAEEFDARAVSLIVSL